MGKTLADIHAAMDEVAKARNPSIAIPDDKEYRAILTDSSGNQKVEEYKARNFARAFYTASDFEPYSYVASHIGRRKR
jgi:hypothetical protein